MDTQLKSILIDDNPHHLASLETQLSLRCSQVQVIAQTSDPIEGLQLVKQEIPDLLFLDVQMPQLNGLELARELYSSMETLPEIIFVTGYEDFAIQAFEVNACRYLIKPPSDLQLISAVEKAQKNRRKQAMEKSSQEIGSLLQYVSHPKVSIPTLKGSDFIFVKDIIRIESDNNLSNWYLVEDKSYKAVSRTLKEVEQLLGVYQFVRCHNRHIVNPGFIHQYTKPGFLGGRKHTGGGQLSLANGETIPVSREGRNRLKAKKLIG